MDREDSISLLPEQPQQAPAVQLPAAPSRRRRATVACRRCRQHRTKCIHDNDTVPCERCSRAGGEIAAACAFIIRTQKDPDREIRRRPKSQLYESIESTEREKATAPDLSNDGSQDLSLEQSKSSDTALSDPCSPPLASQDQWNLLPPFAEVMEGCRAYTASCFQIGFIPKALFLERLTKDRNSISVFLLLSMLSISARHTPSLCRRYGGDSKATNYFIDQASGLIANEIYEPSIERIQAFMLLGVSEWVQGKGTRSAMHMGIAVRMASILHLHREESYALPDNPTVEDIIESEGKRRTFWLLESQEHLYAEYNAAFPFALKDITTLLPSNENDFAFGIVPMQRSALAGTQAALSHPELLSLPSTSLFATVVQAHNLWGHVARRAGRAARSERKKADVIVNKPWEQKSDYWQLTQTLKEWEKNMPSQHRWSEWNFRGYKAKFLGRAYLSEVIVTRLSNIVVRRIYLDDICESMLGTSTNDCPTPDFWTDMSHELFINVCSMHDIINTYFNLRVDNEGTPAILVFCVYVCGSLASHLWKCPRLCPEVASRAEDIVNKSLEVLHGLLPYWPIASRWLDALRKVACPMQIERRAMSSLEVDAIDSASFLNLGMGEMMNRDRNISGSAATTETLNSNYGIEQFLDGTANIDFGLGFDFDGQLLQFL